MDQGTMNLEDMQEIMMRFHSAQTEVTPKSKYFHQRMMERRDTKLLK
jgi:hypothetical protein